MNVDKTLARVFQERTYVFVRVTPDGFERTDGSPVATLLGRIQKHHLIRKRFEGGRLACDSRDGVRSRRGFVCDECRHPLCRPQLRVHLVPDFTTKVTYVVDLAVTSAQNLLALSDELAREEKRLDDVLLQLLVVRHGHWGEVRFERRP